MNAKTKTHTKSQLNKSTEHGTMFTERVIPHQHKYAPVLGSTAGARTVTINHKPTINPISLHYRKIQYLKIIDKVRITE